MGNEESHSNVVDAPPNTLSPQPESVRRKLRSSDVSTSERRSRTVGSDDNGSGQRGKADVVIQVPKEDTPSTAFSTQASEGSSVPDTPSRVKQMTFNMKPQFEGNLSGSDSSPEIEKKKKYLKRLVSTIRVNPERSLAVGVTKNGELLQLSSKVTPDLEAANFHNINEVVSGTLVSEEYESFQVGPPVEEDGKHFRKLRTYFNRVDVNKDGFLSRDDLQATLKLSSADNKVDLKPEVLDELVELIMEEADLDGGGKISFEELAIMLYSLDRSSRDHDRGSSTKFKSFLSDNADEDPIDEIPDKPTQLRHWTKGLLRSKIFRQEVHFYLMNNWQQLLVVSVWLQLCSFVFLWRFFAWTRLPIFQITGYWISISKGSAEVVKLNMAILLLLVCKSTMTFLKSTFLGYFIPFDDRIEFHKIVSGMIVFASLVHTLGHLIGNYTLIANAGSQLFQSVYGDGVSHPTYVDLLKSTTSQTGYILWGALLVLSVFALNHVRRWMKRTRFLKSLGGFEVFWWTHMLLFPVFYFFSIYHGSHSNYLQQPTTTTWIYLIGPLILYILERVNRVVLSRTRYTVDVIKAEVLPGRVLALHMSAPPFMYKSGMYIYVQVPAISTFEWHPFSITSAPSDFELSIHMRAVGDWTNEMLEFWSREIKKADSLGFDVSGKDQISIPMDDNSMYRFPKILIDGPIGAPAQDYEDFRVAVLIAGGIGVTPFASILRDVLHKSKNARKYPRCRVGKIYFNWTNRDQASFEWFHELMDKVSQEDEAGIIEMNNFLTSAYGDDDPRSFLLKVLQEEYHSKTGIDIITNQKTKILTHFARPDWTVILSDIMAKHPKTRIGVLVCGPEALSGELRKKCHDLTVASRNGSSFIFRKENF